MRSKLAYRVKTLNISHVFVHDQLARRIAATPTTSSSGSRYEGHDDEVLLLH